MTINLTQELIGNFKEYGSYDIDATFIRACREGHLDIVKYLLTSPDLIKSLNIDGVEYKFGQADIHADNDEGVNLACYYGHLEIIKYLLPSKDLKDHADIHADSDDGFILACANNNLDIVKYLLNLEM